MKKIILLIMCLTLCSCFDYKELNEIRIIDYMFIDNDNGYSFKLHEVNNDDLISMDMNEFNNSDDLFMEHIKYIYLSDSLCRDGILDILTYIINTNRFSNSYKLFIGNDTDNSKYGLDGISIYKSLLDDSTDIGIFNVDNNMIGYFKDDKLIGYIDDDIYRFIMFNDGYDISDGINSISLYNNKIKYSDGNIEIKCFGKINNTDYNIYNYDELSNKLSSILKNKIKDYIDITYNSGSNLFGINEDYNIEVNIILNKNGNTI